MSLVSSDFKLSKVTVNYAEKRNLYVDYFMYESKKDREEYGDSLIISPPCYEDSDGGIYFRIHDCKNGEFVAVLSGVHLDKEYEKVNLFFENNPELKIINGEKELRKFIDKVSEILM